MLTALETSYSLPVSYKTGICCQALFHFFGLGHPPPKAGDFAKLKRPAPTSFLHSNKPRAVRSGAFMAPFPEKRSPSLP